MSTTLMASAILTPPYLSSSPTIRKPTLSTSFTSNPNSPNFGSFSLIAKVDLSSWSGLRQQGFSISQQFLKLERGGACKAKGVFASLFGVGAPEALVIGVVALLVFGPKGLAEVARNLGKTLRAFQPTIRELQEVSREFKTTLEKEIGIDDIQNPLQSSSSSNTVTPTSPPPPAAKPEDSQAVVDPNGSSSPNKAYSSEDYLKVTEEQLKEAASLQQKEQTQIESQDTVQEVAAISPPVESPKVIPET